MKGHTTTSLSALIIKSVVPKKRGGLSATKKLHYLFLKELLVGYRVVIGEGLTKAITKNHLLILKETIFKVKE